MEEMAKGMGFNPYLIEYANIREQCAFVHAGSSGIGHGKGDGPDPNGRGEGKSDSNPFEKGREKVEKKGLVVGGGLAGMTASLRLAEQGYEVYLIEKEKELGGNLRESFYTLKGSDPQGPLAGNLSTRLKPVSPSIFIPRQRFSDLKGRMDIIGRRSAIRMSETANEMRRFSTMEP